MTFPYLLLSSDFVKYLSPLCGGSNSFKTHLITFNTFLLFQQKFLISEQNLVGFERDSPEYNPELTDLHS